MYVKNVSCTNNRYCNSTSLYNCVLSMNVTRDTCTIFMGTCTHVSIYVYTWYYMYAMYVMCSTCTCVHDASYACIYICMCMWYTSVHVTMHRTHVVYCKSASNYPCKINFTHLWKSCFQILVSFLQNSFQHGSLAQFDRWIWT